LRKLFSGRRRYALACLVAIGGLLTAAASCESVKEAPKPVKEPAPTGLSIQPTSWDFGTSNTSTAKTFTVTNNCPDESGTLATNLTGPDDSDFALATAGNDNTYGGTTLAAGEKCVVEATFDPGPGDEGAKQAGLLVNSDVPADGEAIASLTGTAV
jgi:hypothetical protein